jgi:hypothetical protein
MRLLKATLINGTFHRDSKTEMQPGTKVFTDGRSLSGFLPVMDAGGHEPVLLRPHSGYADTPLPSSLSRFPVWTSGPRVFQQIRAREQHPQLRQILFKAPVSHFAEPEQPFHYPEYMLHFAPHLQF